MTIEAFNQFIAEHDAFLRTLHGHGDREHIFARTVKITEELGELASEVLASQGDQRREKLEGKGEHDLADEFADVLITTALLAKSLNIDLMEAAERKIEKIRSRRNEHA